MQWNLPAAQPVQLVLLGLTNFGGEHVEQEVGRPVEAEQDEEVWYWFPFPEHVLQDLQDVCLW